MQRRRFEPGVKLAKESERALGSLDHIVNAEEVAVTQGAVERGQRHQVHPSLNAGAEPGDPDRRQTGTAQVQVQQADPRLAGNGPVQRRRQGRALR